ncbi:MAG: hypothetical protein ACJ8GN_26865 [Longimicrobiaceae bacterium]
MHTITGITSLSSGFTPEYLNVRTLELEGPVFDGGAFGDVYDLVAVNGAPPPTSQIVKVLRDNGFDSARQGFETIEKLQRKILDDTLGRKAAGKPPIQRLPALRALPQFSFRGQMGRDPVFGYSADRLDTAGYLPLSHILDPEEDPEPRERYVSELTLEDRMLLAYELAEGVEALQRLSYIHADINPPNLFVNIAECHVALIDFDSGAVTDAPGETPTTFGKKMDGEWVAPEIMDQILTHRGGPIVVRVDRFTDDWAVTVGIHYLLFLCGPFFGLQRSTPRNIRDYVTRFGWPAFDAADPLFMPEVEENHESYMEMLGDLPAPVLARMSGALNSGAADPRKRALPYQWMADLGTVQEALEIILFQVEPETALEGRPVRLTWRVAGARWVSIDNGIGEVDETGTCEVVTAGSGSYTLTARARAGATLSETASVRVVPFPVIRSLSVPAPELSHTVVIRGMRVPAPTVALAAPAIRVGAPTIRVPLSLDLSVRFAGANAPRATAIPSTPPGPGPARAPTRWIPRLGDVLDHLSDRMKAEITARFGAMP